MKDPKNRDRLFNHICLGDQYDSLRQGSMEAGLASLCRVRRRKQLTRVAACACVPLLLLSLWLYRSASQAPSAISPPRPPLAKSTAQPAALEPEPTGLEVVSQAEFLELFERYPGQSVALIQRPGRQPIVLLGNAEAN